MEEEDDLSQFLDAQQEVRGLQVGGSSQSSDRSSRGCTPPLSSLSWQAVGNAVDDLRCCICAHSRSRRAPDQEGEFPEKEEASEQQS